MFWQCRQTWILLWREWGTCYSSCQGNEAAVAFWSECPGPLQLPPLHTCAPLSHSSSSWLALGLWFMQSKKSGHCAVPASVLLWAISFIVLRYSPSLLEAVKSLHFHSEAPELDLYIVQVSEKAVFIIQLLTNNKYLSKAGFSYQNWREN